jgi:hypothetical protein
MVAGRLVNTGRTKVGCFVGDHTKAGLSTLLNTGASVGAFCNLLPGGLLPRHVPSFCTASGASLWENTDLKKALQTAGAVMRRRGRSLSEAQAALYRALLAQTAPQRQAALREAEGGLRRSA